MSLRRIWTGRGERGKEKKPAKCSNGPKCSNGLKKTRAATYHDVQAWLLEKPAAWVGEDTPSLVAALVAQRPPYMRPRKDASVLPASHCGPLWGAPR